MMPIPIQNIIFFRFLLALELIPAVPTPASAATPITHAAQNSSLFSLLCSSSFMFLLSQNILKLPSEGTEHLVKLSESEMKNIRIFSCFIMTSIPLQDIVITPVMVDMILKYNPLFETKKYIVIDDGTFSLDEKRLQSVLDSQDCKEIIPIKLKKVGSEKSVKPWRVGKINFLPTIYTVIDGRHRIVAGIIREETCITANIVE